MQINHKWIVSLILSVFANILWEDGPDKSNIWYAEGRKNLSTLQRRNWLTSKSPKSWFKASHSYYTLIEGCKYTE